MIKDIEKILNDKEHRKLIGIIIAIVLVVLILTVLNKLGIGKEKKVSANPTIATTTISPSESASIAESQSVEAANIQIESDISSVVDSYKNLGLVKVDGFLNIRKEPTQDSEIIGKLYNGSGLEILETKGEDWLHIKSGDVDGYISSKYVLLGDDAKKAAREQVKERAIVKPARLNVRKEPSIDAEIVDAVYQNERYEILESKDGWLKISLGYISSEFTTSKLALNEARKLDLRSMVVNRYAKLGISNVTGYLNIRKEPKADGEIIGKLPSKAAGDILETLDGWYKIQSGPLTGYVSSEFILTGEAAKQEAMEQAELMAVVRTDVLNARTEPDVNAKIWTQISNLEKYPVVTQKDGWVEIELENDNNAFVDTGFVDVVYALNEAIKFSPAEEAEKQSISRRTQIVNYALKYLGNPYVWGGTSLTNGCDCSGFTMGVLGNYGVGLPHYSGSQAQMGVKINSSQMRPGDLIFYSNKRGTINHVAMYIGNGQIVHAASRRSGIKISQWNYRTPTTIRNVIGD